MISSSELESLEARDWKAELRKWNQRESVHGGIL